MLQQNKKTNCKPSNIFFFRFFLCKKIATNEILVTDELGQENYYLFCVIEVKLLVIEKTIQK